MEHLALNERIGFGFDGNAAPYLGAGWSTTTEHALMTWTSETTAEFRFRAAAPRNDKKIVIEFDAFTHGDAVREQQVWVYLNGWFVGFVKATGYCRTTFNLRSLQFATRGNVLSFVIPTAVSPSSVSLGEDARVLGICMKTIEFTD